MNEQFDPYVSLHNHTEHSFLDGYSKVQAVVDRAVSLGQNAVAITDHGECSGHIDLEKACKAAGIKPIFGMEGYIVDDVEEVRKAKDKLNNHLCLWAETSKGLSNLWALSTLGYRNLYYKPLIDWSILNEYSEGLIVSDGCMLSNTARYILREDMDGAKQWLSNFLMAVGDDNFFMELHTWRLLEPYAGGITQEQWESEGVSKLEVKYGPQAVRTTQDNLKLNSDMTKINLGKVKLANELGIPLIVVNDSHYSCEDDWENHSLVWAMSTNQDQTDSNGPTAAWMMSSEEVHHHMSAHGVPTSVVDEAIQNTQLIGQRVQAEVERKLHIPTLTGSDEKDLELYYQHVESGFKRKVEENPNIPDEEKSKYRERVEAENSLIVPKEFYGYFNIVADYCLSPETPVLTSDLRWVPVGDLEVGQKIAGFDEMGVKKPDKSKTFRYWKESEVLATKRVELPCYRVTLEDGTETIASEDHRWLVFKGHRARPAEWVRTRDLLSFRQDSRYHGEKLLPVKAFKVVDTWEQEDSWDEGYLGGLLDGEAWLNLREYEDSSGTYNFSLGFGQNEGPVLEKYQSLLRKWEVPFKIETKFRDSICRTVNIAGPRANVLKVLGKSRPERLLRKVDLNRLGRLRAIDRVEILSVEYLGVQEVVAVETSTSTMIAQGFAHHNCQYAKGWGEGTPWEGKKIPWLVGPSRGSAGGSLNVFLMDITEMNPLPYGAIFERFISPGRGVGRVELVTDKDTYQYKYIDQIDGVLVRTLEAGTVVTIDGEEQTVESCKVTKLPDYPDIDLDFPQSKRGQLKKYLEWKYGSDNVCAVGTFSRLQPRGILQDLCRAMSIDYEDSRKMSKIIEGVKDIDTANIDVSWDEVLQEAGGDLAEWARKYPRLFQKMSEMMGLIRQSSTHASGIIISDDSLVGQLPMRVKEGELVSQFEMFTLEELGFIKFDILGIRHLDTIMNADMMAGKVRVTMEDGSVREFRLEEEVETKRGKIRAEELTDEDELMESVG